MVHINHTLFLMVVILLLNESVGEYRKLIPKCLNSCLTSGVVSPTNCFCDSKCSLIYNDCCLDAPYRTFRVTTKRNHNINCIFVHGENSHFWMVDTCKDDWSGQDHVRAKCTETSMVSGESNDIIGSLPITNPFEGYTYKNYYCALCNDEETENLIQWRVKALCLNQGVTQDDILHNLTYVEDWQQWGVWKIGEEDEWVFHECHLLFERPPNITNGVRHCVSGMVSTCPSGWKNIATRRKCKSYVDPVRWGDGPVYRNIECAVCHNKTRTGFRCLYDVTRGSSAVMLDRAMSVDLSCTGQWL